MQIVIKYNCKQTPFLYKICILCCMDVWALLGRVTLYGSHDMRHTDFLRVDGGQQDTSVLGHHKNVL